MPATVYKILSKLFLQEVIVPVQTKISDARVVRIYNTALIVTTAMAGLFFVFAWKSWAVATPIMTGINMWVDKSISSDFPDPVYCNNANWDYMYSATWTYDNVKCTKPPLDMVFLKGYGVPGSFWVSSYFSHKFSESKQCHNADTNSTCIGGDLSTHIGVRKNEYVSGVEEYVLSSQISLSVPNYHGENYDGRTTKQTVRIIIVKPDGSTVEVEHKKLVIQKTVGEWIELFGLGSLDKTSENLNGLYGVSGDTGDIRLRFTGINLYLDMEISNHDSYFEMPGDIFIKIHLSVDLNWQRTIYPSVPTSLDKRTRSTDAYGMRFVWKTKETNVLVFSAGHAAITVLDLFVFFNVTEVICILIFMKCFGGDSKKWNHARRKHIDNFVDESVVADIRLGNRSKPQRRMTMPVSSSRKVIPRNKKNAELDERIVQFVEKVFPIFDQDKDGALNPIEARNMIEAFTKHDVSVKICTEILQSIDQDGNAAIEPEELIKFVQGGIQLIFNEKSKKAYAARSPTHKVIIEFFVAVDLRLKYGGQR